jgi:hypothetical protein
MRPSGGQLGFDFSAPLPQEPPEEGAPAAPRFPSGGPLFTSIRQADAFAPPSDRTRVECLRIYAESLRDLDEDQLHRDLAAVQRAGSEALTALVQAEIHRRAREWAPDTLQEDSHAR